MRTGPITRDVRAYGPDVAEQCAMVDAVPQAQINATHIARAAAVQAGTLTEFVAIVTREATGECSMVAAPLDSVLYSAGLLPARVVDVLASKRDPSQFCMVVIDHRCQRIDAGICEVQPPPDSPEAIASPTGWATVERMTDALGFESVGELLAWCQRHGVEVRTAGGRTLVQPSKVCVAIEARLRRATQRPPSDETER